MNQSDAAPESILDPRVRRTRKWIGDALVRLLEEKSFAEISITDITRQADIARVTFYQHFDSKEAVLLALASDFFEHLYQLFDLSALLQTGETLAQSGVGPLPVSDEFDLQQAHLVRVALEAVGPAVRRLAVASFVQALARSGFSRPEAEAQVLATYHVNGILGLLESYLNDELLVSPVEFRELTLTLLRLLPLCSENLTRKTVVITTKTTI